MDYVKFSDKYEFVYSHHRTAPASSRLQLHYHDVMEFYFITNGSCNYFINEKSYDIEKDDIIIIPKGILHKINTASADHAYIIMYCQKRHIPYSVIPYLKNMPYLYRNPRIVGEVKHILNSIEREFKSPDNFSNDEILLYIHMLFFLLVRNLDTTIPVRANNMHVEEILQYIQKNYSQNITLKSLSQEFMLSAEHISRILKKETGFNFIEYLTTVRMHKAEELLLADKKMSVSEIAFRCGFNDSNYFSERFKFFHKITPSQFRKK